MKLLIFCTVVRNLILASYNSLVGSNNGSTILHLQVMVQMCFSLEQQRFTFNEWKKLRQTDATGKTKEGRRR
jgi:hypothetical protein